MEILILNKVVLNKVENVNYSLNVRTINIGKKIPMLYHVHAIIIGSNVDSGVIYKEL